VEATSSVADSGDPEQDLTDLLGEIGEVAQATGAGALFLIDEMHNLDASALAAICSTRRLFGRFRIGDSVLRFADERSFLADLWCLRPPAYGGAVLERLGGSPVIAAA
jgi:hypothetical protein